ncbi:MAG: DUF882 domain-containing protein [Labrys sp. (in: a-proteobacteria)]
MVPSLRSAPSKRSLLRWAGTVVAAFVAVTVMVRPTQDAIANGDTRVLNIYHTHTRETLQVTFKRNGTYDQDGLKKLNWFLRDWRRDEPTRMDPRLFDIVWAAYREVGGSQPIHVVSAYRAPETNAMLRRRSRGVAKFSQHTLGKAMDFYIPGVPIANVRIAALRLQRGGVGFYPTAGKPFVHLDAGSVRMWPRMTRDQLVRVFPDGKTVHLPADGKKMPRYAEAYAELVAGGVSVRGATQIASASGGGASEDEEGGDAASNFDPSSPLAVLFQDKQPKRSRPIRSETVMTAAADTKANDAAETEAPPAAASAAAETAKLTETDKSTETAVAEATPAAVPMPAEKPDELDQPAGPVLAWQTGAQPVDAQQADGAVPMPPARPGEDAPPASPDDGPIVVANAELPPEPAPERLASEAGVAAVDGAGAATAPDKPITVAEAVLPSATVASAAPASAVRGLLLEAAPIRGAAADPIGAMLAEKSAPVAPKLAYAAEEQAARGVNPDTAPIARGADGLVATRFEHQDFAVVSRPIGTARDLALAGLVMPDLGSVDTMISKPTRFVVIRFGLAAYQDLRVERFTGQAIRPLKTAAVADTDPIVTGSIASTQ